MDEGERLEEERNDLREERAKGARGVRKRSEGGRKTGLESIEMKMRKEKRSYKGVV